MNRASVTSHHSRMPKVAAKKRVAKLREKTATADEIAAIKVGGRDLVDGHFVTLQQLKSDPNRPNRRR